MATSIDFCDNLPVIREESNVSGIRFETSTPTECVNESVPIKQFEAVLKLLEDERIVHAQTKSELMETKDKLEFALGDIEILQKQITREKIQFEKAFGVLKNKTMKESCRNVDLINKCQDIEHKNEEREINLNQRESEIQELTGKLERQRKSYLQQLQELDIKKQQEAYILRLSQGDKLSGTRGHSDHTTSARNVYPMSDIDRQQEDYICNMLESITNYKHKGSANQSAAEMTQRSVGKNNKYMDKKCKKAGNSQSVRTASSTGRFWYRHQ